MQCLTTLPSQLIAIPWPSFMANPRYLVPSGRLPSTLGMTKYQFSPWPSISTAQQLYACEASLTSYWEEFPRSKLRSMVYPTRRRRSNSTSSLLIFLRRKSRRALAGRVAWTSAHTRAVVKRSSPATPMLPSPSPSSSPSSSSPSSSYSSSSPSSTPRATPSIGATGLKPEFTSVSLITEYTWGKQRLPISAKSTTSPRMTSSPTLEFAAYGTLQWTVVQSAGLSFFTMILVPIAIIPPTLEDLALAVPFPLASLIAAHLPVSRLKNCCRSSWGSIFPTFLTMTTDSR